MFGVGAAATGVTPTWIKFILIAGGGGYLLLMAEFEYEQQKAYLGGNRSKQRLISLSTRKYITF